MGCLSILDLSKAAMMHLNETESKAAVMSTKQERANRPFAKVVSMSETTLWRASSVERPFLNPNWLSLRDLSMCRCSLR